MADINSILKTGFDKNGDKRQEYWNTLVNSRTTITRNLDTPIMNKDINKDEDIKVINKDISGITLYDVKKDEDVQKEEIKDILIRLLKEDSLKHYSPTFMRICEIIYFVYHENTINMLEILIEYFFRDFNMENSMLSAPMLKFCFEIVIKENQAVAQDIEIINPKVDESLMIPNTESLIATWFTDKAEKIEDKLRTFNFILSTNFIMPYYIAAACIISAFKKRRWNKKKIDHSTIINKMNKIKITKDILRFSLKLYQKHPPSQVIDSLINKLDNEENDILYNSALYENVNEQTKLDLDPTKYMFNRRGLVLKIKKVNIVLLLLLLILTTLLC